MASFTDPIASFGSSNFTPDRLVVSLDDVLTKKITLVSGQNTVRGAVLGAIALGAVTSAAKAGGNTGAGTLTVDAITPKLAKAKVGVYAVRVLAVGTIIVKDPDGIIVGDAAYGAGATITFADQIKFAFADDAITHYVAGDGFDVTIAAGSGKYALAASAAVDGSQTPDVILVETTDATSGDKEALGYYVGRFNPAALTFGTGITATSAFEVLREKGIYLVPTPQAAKF